MKGLIVSSGAISNLKRLECIAKKCDFVLCADGGANHLLKIKYKPNLVVGDLDSIDKKTLKILEEEKVPINRFPSKKDATDTELAIEYLIQKGFKDITLMGVTGTRKDHTLANVFLLKRILDNGIKGKIVDDNNIIYLIDNYLKLKYHEDTFVSIIPITDEGIVVTLQGFEYPLDKTQIDFGSTHGVSNKIVENVGQVIIHKGKCLVFVSKD
ncbi:thiamine diphosphokinase [Tissierella sp. MSJ-40]|uniref:Thiamine diphosphokinase n=1 Tax=Tissierella simiarum TaxID=2841534 RepID=A0ABS6E5Q3_9FIRM|nr:thiamine diphosphokinase [Tissierella simiarum]MBU5437755.1 thiamine diphosphokinase [Tissierella simiarum]